MRHAHGFFIHGYFQVTIVSVNLSKSPQFSGPFDIGLDSSTLRNSCMWRHERVSYIISRVGNLKKNKYCIFEACKRILDVKKNNT